VRIDLSIPKIEFFSSLLNTGVPLPFPRVNGYVLIPNETGAVVALVVFLGVERSPFPRRVGLKDFGLIDLPFPLRRMHVTPLGTLRERADVEGSGRYLLTRGVSAFPSVGDPVLLPSEEQLRSIVEATGEEYTVQIGTSPLAANARVFVDPDKLFGRHLAILGNTGSGQSCSVAGIIRWCLQTANKERQQLRKPGSAAARFIILDPNGEYRHTFRDLEPAPKIFGVVPHDGTESLRVPAWMWNSAEWSAFAQASPRVQRPLLLEGLRNIRSGASADTSVERRIACLFGGHRTLLASLIRQGPQAYTPFPKNKSFLEQVQHIPDEATYYAGLSAPLQARLDAVRDRCAAVLARRRDAQQRPLAVGDVDLREIQQSLDELLANIADAPAAIRYGEDDPASFDLSTFADFLEALASRDVAGSEQHAATLTWRVRSLLRDRRLEPIIGNEPDVDIAAWLESFLGTRDGNSAQIAIVDLSLVPAEIIHIVVSVVARLMFEAIQRYRRNHRLEFPTVLVLEEAHTFIRRGERHEEDAVPTAAQMCRGTFERIAREGRKFGLGLVLSSQRPYELSPTVLAQFNTFLLHRLVNDQDQQLVGRLVPDNVRGILRELPSLPAGQAVLLGWAAAVPVLVDLKRLPKEHQPQSSDPEYWRVWIGASPRHVDWAAEVREWLGTPAPAPNEGADAGRANRGDGPPPDDAGE